MVRSPGLRKAIRQCLRNNNINPDDFTEEQMESLTTPEHYKLRFPKSGRPIYDVTMVRTLKDPIEIVGRDGVHRYYVGGNNHHVEVVEDVQTGTWEFHGVDMFTAAARAKPPKVKRQAMINRNHGPGKRFIMSLAQGETRVHEKSENGTHQAGGV